MKSLRKKWQDADRRAGEFRFEGLLPLNKIGNWLQKVKDHFRKPAKMVWVYEGCDCVPEAGARSVPYCNKHYNPLVRKEIAK